MFPAKITLSNIELMAAAYEGVRIQCRKRMKKSKPTHSAGHENDWQYAIQGSIGEITLARYLNVFWCGAPQGGGDVDGFYEVRCSMKHNATLKVYDENKSDAPYVLITGINGDMIIQGWMWGHEAKNRSLYWRDSGERCRSEGYCIPIKDLNKGELPKR